MDGLGEDSGFGESLDELPHVCSIRDRIASDFCKVAALTGIDKHSLDRHHGIQWGVKVAQVEVEVFWSDSAIDIFEVVEDLASGGCSKTMEVVGQCVDVDWWDSLDDELLDLVVETLSFG